MKTAPLPEKEEENGHGHRVAASGGSANRNYETVEALVDPGATYTLVSAAILARLGVVPHGSRRFALADGSRVERGFGSTWMRFNGREDISPVVS